MFYQLLKQKDSESVRECPRPRIHKMQPLNLDNLVLLSVLLPLLNECKIVCMFYYFAVSKTFFSL